MVGTYPAGASTTGRSIGNLTNGTEYAVTVTASNEFHTSPASASATATPVDARSPNTVTATIRWATAPKSMAVSPDGTTVYVTNNSDDTVSVIEHHATTPSAPPSPWATAREGVAVSPDGTTAYVTNNCGRHRQRHPTPLDNTVTTTIPVGDEPYGLAITPDGTTVYVTNGRDNTVSVIRTSDNTVTDTIHVGLTPGGVAISPDGTTAYVTNNSDDSVSVIRTSDNKVTETFPVGDQPYRLAVSPDGSHRVRRKRLGRHHQRDPHPRQHRHRRPSPSASAREAWRSAPTAPPCTAPAPAYANVRVIQTSDNTVIDTIYDLFHPGDVAISPDGTTVYVIEDWRNNVKVIEFRSVPDVPETFVANPGIREVAVSWETPRFDGMSPITGYTIEYREAGSTSWASTDVGAVNTHRLTGLSD